MTNIPGFECQFKVDYLVIAAQTLVKTDDLMVL